MADCNNVCNMPFDKVVEYHKERGAELTVVYTESNEGDRFISVDDQGNVIGVTDKVKGKKANRTVGYYVFTKDILVNVLERCQLHGKKDFYRDVLGSYLNRSKVAGYRFDGYLRTIVDHRQLLRNKHGSYGYRGKKNAVFRGRTGYLPK